MCRKINIQITIKWIISGEEIHLRVKGNKCTFKLYFRWTDIFHTQCIQQNSIENEQ